MPFLTKTFKQVIPIDAINATVGTWAKTYSSGLYYLLKTAADDTSILYWEFSAPRRSDEFGVKLKKIYIPFLCATAGLDAAPTFALYNQSYSGVDSAGSNDPAATVVAQTHDGVATVATKARLMTVTITTPAWETSSPGAAPDMTGWTAALTLNAAATSVIRVYAPVVEFEALL